MLTCLRGVAAWWVVFYHFRENIEYYINASLYRIVERGHLAVDLFFVLSGCVIYLNYWQLLSSPNSKSISNFLVARLARVYPLHLFMSIIYLFNVIAILFFSSAKYLGERYDFGYYILSLFLIQNWGFTNFLAWNVPSWSISAEFLVYLLFPILCLGMTKIRTVAQSLILYGACVIILGTIFTSSEGNSLGIDIPRLGAARCLFEFTMGVCIAWSYLHKGPPTIWEAWGFCLISVLTVYFGFSLNFEEYWVIPVAFGCLIRGMMFDLSSGTIRILRPVIYVGEISYSTYLVHYFVRDWVKFIIDQRTVTNATIFLIYISFVLILSIVLFHWVEAPSRHHFRGALQSSSEGRATKPNP